MINIWNKVIRYCKLSNWNDTRISLGHLHLKWTRPTWDDLSQSAGYPTCVRLWDTRSHMLAPPPPQKKERKKKLYLLRVFRRHWCEHPVTHCASRYLHGLLNSWFKRTFLWLPADRYPCSSNFYFGVLCSPPFFVFLAQESTYAWKSVPLCFFFVFLRTLLSLPEAKIVSRYLEYELWWYFK